MDESSSSDRLYLDDLHVRQRFTSATYAIDETQIKTFAVQFDPQPFHTDEKAAESISSKAWPRAAGIPPQSRCVSMLRAARRSPAALSGLEPS
jgi:hypothetical protein